MQTGMGGFRATDPPLPVCVESRSCWMLRCCKASVAMTWCAGLGPGTCLFGDHTPGITPGSSREVRDRCACGCSAWPEVLMIWGTAC
ncbi:unnamed protein product [Ectocarpus sp. 12 AP-2014]